MSPIHIVVVRCRLVLQISLGHIDDRKQGDTIGMKLSHLARSFLPRKQTPVTPPNRDDSLLPTHPSDLKKFKERQVDREAYDRDHQHYVAFLVLVLLYYGNGFPSGAPRGPDGVCTSVRVCLLDAPFLFHRLGLGRMWKCGFWLGKLFLARERVWRGWLY